MDRSSNARIIAKLLSPVAIFVTLMLIFTHGASEVLAQKIIWSDRERPIAKEIEALRSLPDDVRARTTRQLALDIRQLPVLPNKLTLALDLANLSTEGDFGRDTLQEVTTTLAEALREQPQPSKDGKVPLPYMELAELVRYEHMQASPLNDPQFSAAIAALEAADRRREHADFTLTDLAGKSWTLQQLRGKVVLVNFWATWCPPCRKELPDLQALYSRFQAQGFLILAISDEGVAKVKPFVEDRNLTYPVLLDPGRKVNQLFEVQGIPKSFVYDRDGKLVAESIDMRTQQQFLDMLGRAGLR